MGEDRGEGKETANLFFPRSLGQLAPQVTCGASSPAAISAGTSGKKLMAQQLFDGRCFLFQALLFVHLQLISEMDNSIGLTRRLLLRCITMFLGSLRWS